MDASAKVTLIVLLLIGSALIVIAMQLPRIAPMWTIQYSPFAGQVVAALAYGRPLNAENLSSPDWREAVVLEVTLEHRVRRGDFDGTERYLDFVSTHDRNERRRLWAHYLGSELRRHGGYVTGVPSP